MTEAIKWRIRSDQASLAARVGVARHKPCSGCGRSWDECGGGWVDPAKGTAWTCNDCMPPADNDPNHDCEARPAQTPCTIACRSGRGYGKAAR